MRIWIDTEFIDRGYTILPLSFGLVREDGLTYYAEPAETKRSLAGAWVKRHVLPLMRGPVKTSSTIRRELRKFCGNSPEFWSHCASHDWTLICALFGGMARLPKTWPQVCLDNEQLRYSLGVNRSDLPERVTKVHHALNDALWHREAWIYLVKDRGGRRLVGKAKKRASERG